jgi:hypothetical protein
MSKYVFLTLLLGLINFSFIQAQFMSYRTIESDSMVIAADTIQLKDQVPFQVKIEEPLDNHPYYLRFLLSNPTSHTLTVVFGSEGVITPITQQVILEPNQTEWITYVFKNVRTPGSYFSQLGKICSFTAGTDGSAMGDVQTYQYFLISGVWKFQ